MALWPNNRAALDAAMTFLFRVNGHWPRVGDIGDYLKVKHGT
jgi:hypothetical protein